MNTIKEQLNPNNHFENKREPYVKIYGSIVTDWVHGDKIDLFLGWRR
jgi:hypothetical protein